MTFGPIVLLVAAILIFLGLAVWLGARIRRKRTARAAATQEFPAKWDRLLGSAFPLYRRIPTEVRDPLRRQMLAFMADKNFEACGGLEEVSDEMKLLVAVQACLLVWDDPRVPPYPELRSILFYPSTFRHSADLQFAADDEGVLLEEGSSPMLGESWDSGSVVLSWESVRRGGSNVEDGMNVVIHEFAHQLDQEAGSADGLPRLRTVAEHREWAEAFGAAWEKFTARVHHRRDLVLDPYGATNPAEFFAVASETFFEKARQLRESYPEVYEQLAHFYRLDPAEWRRIVT